MNEIKRLVLKASWPFKIGILCLVVVLILHTVGLSTNHWSTADSSSFKLNFTIERVIKYKAGLWSHCACATMFQYESCKCIDKNTSRAWFVATQVIVVLALVCLLVSCVLSLAVIFSSRQDKIKIANIVMTTSSGVLIAVAVILYGMEANDHIDSAFTSLPFISSSKYNYSFICCCVAAVFCLVVVVPLFVFDAIRARKTPPSMVTTTVQYTTQE